MDLFGRTEPEEWRIVSDLYPSLRRFAAVAAPFDLEPDDLLQEALVAVLRKRRLTELDQPLAYLRRAIVNVAAQHSRRMVRRRAALRRYAAPASAAVSPGYPSDLAELYRLSPGERSALYLHEVEGYRFSEIASMLGCSEAAAKKAGSRARRRLAAELSAGRTT